MITRIENQVDHFNLKADWCAIIGGEYHFNPRWSTGAEVGFGRDKRQILLGVTCRF